MALVAVTMRIALCQPRYCSLDLGSTSVPVAVKVLLCSFKSLILFCNEVSHYYQLPVQEAKIDMSPNI